MHPHGPALLTIAAIALFAPSADAQWTKTTLFWPWIWGPGYQVYGADDRPNGEPLAFARAQGGLGGYVHPVRDRDPFSEQGRRSVPVMLAADGILGNLDWLEVACLWSDSLGRAASHCRPAAGSRLAPGAASRSGHP